MADPDSPARTIGACILGLVPTSGWIASSSIGRRERNRCCSVPLSIDLSRSSSRRADAMSDAMQATAEERNALVRWWERASRIDPRYLIAFLITLVLVAAQVRYHMLGSYDRLVVALGVCMATEA